MVLFTPGDVGRPVDRQADEPCFNTEGTATREGIIAGASQLISQRGLTATTNDDVRTAADVSNWRLHHYFADQHDFVAAVITYRSQLLLGFQEPYLAGLGSIEALRVWRDAIVDQYQEQGRKGGCRSDRWRDPDNRQALAAAFERYEEAIRSGLQRMRERGELSAAAGPNDLALATLAALEGGLLLSQVRRSTAPLEQALDRMLDHIESYGTPYPEQSALPTPEIS